MPELPEVETVANGVHARVAGQRISSVWCSGKPQTFKTAPSQLEHALHGLVIERVHRVGKHIVVDLVEDSQFGRRPEQPTTWSTRSGLNSFELEHTERDTFTRGTSDTPQLPVAELLVHLGMTGRLLVSQADVPMPTHTHLQLTLEDGRELRFVDARRFGRLELRRLKTDLALLAVQRFTGPGTEPLTILPDAFLALFQGRKLAIKAALLNQKLLHGVGNIYADESLHRAGIRPSLPAGKISRPRLRRLHAELQTVVSDYVDADGVRGFFQLEHRVYGRTGQPCTTCGTPIRRSIIGGRSTHSCAQCQT
jgi:formamidopyrimidine-DNA glycosylase